MAARRPERVDLYLPVEIQEEMDRNRLDAGDNGAKLDRSPYVARLIREDTKRRAEAEHETLFTLSKREPERTRKRMLAALTMTEGNAAAAQRAFGASKRDWERAVEELRLMDPIIEEHPRRRAVQRRKGRARS